MREGIKQGDKLAILAVNQIDVVVTYFACYKLGVIAVPINFMQSVADVTFNLEHSGSKVAVFDPLLSDLVFALRTAPGSTIHRWSTLTRFFSGSY